MTECLTMDNNSAFVFSLYCFSSPQVEISLILRNDFRELVEVRHFW